MLKNWFKLAALLGAGLAVATLVNLTGCSAVQTVNALVPNDTYRLTPDVPYGPNKRQVLDIYQPKRVPPLGGFPVVVFFYGGSWHMGERAQYRFLGEALASHGALVMVADYRVYPEVSYPDFLPDCAQAVVYALTHAQSHGGNPHRVVVMGHSAGAYNAAMIALDPRWLAQQGHAPSELAGWVGLAGPYDFIPIGDLETRETFHHPNVPLDSQPISHVNAKAPRTFLATGITDETVNPERNSIQLAQRLRDAGVMVDFHRYERVGHVSLIGSFAQPLRWLSPALRDVMAFIQSLRTDTP